MHTHTHYHSLSLSHTHTHRDKHTETLTVHIHKCTHAHTHTQALTHTHKHKGTQIPHTHTHRHTHTHTHTQLGCISPTAHATTLINALSFAGPPVPLSLTMTSNEITIPQVRFTHSSCYIHTLYYLIHLINQLICI